MLCLVFIWAYDSQEESCAVFQEVNTHFSCFVFVFVSAIRGCALIGVNQNQMALVLFLGLFSMGGQAFFICGSLQGHIKQGVAFLGILERGLFLPGGEFF